MDNSTSISAVVAGCTADKKQKGMTLAERIAENLNTLHDESGDNKPLKYSPSVANRIAFDAQVEFSKANPAIADTDIPKALKSETKDFRKFNARHTELKRIVGNIEHYEAGAVIMASLKADGTVTQIGGNVLYGAMEAIAEGKGDKYETEQRDNKKTRDDKTADTAANKITLKGFQRQLDDVVEAAEALGFGYDAGTFSAPEVVETKKAEDMPIDELVAAVAEDPGVEAMDDEAIRAMINASPANVALGTAWLKARHA